LKTSEKAYQENSYLTVLESEVLSCIKKDDFYEVILDKTIFYPHMSGGQPKDEGTINGFKVYDVTEDGDQIVHKVKEPLSGMVSISIDFKTRFDYMQQHTGQHILSYSFAQLFNGNTVGFHLGDDYTTIDLDIPLSEDMIEQAEALSNKIIYENKTIIAKTFTYDDALNLNLRKAPPKLDFLRIISIENYDDSACGGTHVGYTGEIGIIKVIKSEKYKSGSRVEFLCGKRVLDDYTIKNKNILDLSACLTCRADMIIDNFNKIFNENIKFKKEIIFIKNELNEYKAKEFKNNAVIKDGIKYIFIKSENDIKDLRYICSKITDDENCLAVLVSENDNTCNLVIGQSKNLNFHIKDIFEKIKNIINGKGGGNNSLLQCSGDVLKAEECLELAKQIFAICI